MAVRRRRPEARGWGRPWAGVAAVIEVTAEASHGVDGFPGEFLQTVERGIDTMHERIRVHLLCPLAKRVQLGSLAGVGFDVRNAHRVVVSHDEKQDRPLQPLGLIELEFRDRKLVGIAIRGHAVSAHICGR